ncbi:hypothetical protein AB0K00_17160 [Dactylosporangium sp. NPDC049525]|uniref:hypothetical protein n=1 Tax=Dactylosporangium sp. NPDC049525 TaxID=3154730 RepID=UPI00341375E5
MSEPTLTTASTVDIGMTAWSALNPFGEPTAFVLVHPISAHDDGTFADTIAALGLRRLDVDGEILPIGTDVLYASLRAMRVELCTPAGVWLSHDVTDDWTANAVGRRYIVLAIGTAPLAADADAGAVAAYLADRASVHTALVRIRVRFDET